MKTNKKIQKINTGFSDLGGTVQQYNANLYSANLNTVYARGTIIGWYKDKKENNGWDEILNLVTSETHRYNVPITLENQIKYINKHDKDQPM